MKYCSKCGNEMFDEAVICVKCGCPCESQEEKSPVVVQNRGLEVAIKVFLILATVINGFYLIPLLWCIPMTVHFFKSAKKQKPMGVGYKICVLLFVSLISGLLLLCKTEQEKTKA